jgi:hypothetical protein
VQLRLKIAANSGEGIPRVEIIVSSVAIAELTPPTSASPTGSGGARVTTWHYAAGHRWQYDNEDASSCMEFRFGDNDQAKKAGLCDCACGFCKPEHPHLVEGGCLCTLFGCPCVEVDM